MDFTIIADQVSQILGRDVKITVEITPGTQIIGTDGEQEDLATFLAMTIEKYL
jgi:hypothetical protein